MSLGLIGQKCGMTRVFTDEGQSVPVTVIQATPNRVTQLKTKDIDGYCAVQVTAGTRKPTRTNKSIAGHFSKAGVHAGSGLWEFLVDENEIDSMSLADEITVDKVFKPGEKVDVTGTTIGKGFAGVVKRYNFKMQDATHGNSLSHRAPGSIGQNQSPGHVFKGKKMAGQMGNKQCTLQNLDIINIDTARNLIILKGAIPGPSGGRVFIRHSKKTVNK